MNRYIAFVLFSAVFFGCGSAWAEDWTTFNHDNHRSSVTAERLELPLKESWLFKATHQPQPAWPGPAKQDYYHHLGDLRATVTYDRAFHIVGAGDTVYFGSSADDKVYALDAMTGQQRWTFFTEGPVRLAPTIAGNKVYVGSDDGCVYCLSCYDGSLVWKWDAKYTVADQNRILPGNGRMMSIWPIRTALVADRGEVYFAAGLFPIQGAYLIALSAEDGSVKWKQKVDISPQGYMLASDERLYVPTGRTGPAIFTRDDGSFKGQLPSAGGAYALLTEDVLVTGPGRGPKELNAADVKTKDKIATFAGLRMLVNGPIAYMQSENKLSAFNRGRYLELSRQRNNLRQQHEKIEKQLKKLDKEAPEAEQLQENSHKLMAELAELSKRLKDCYLWTVQCKYPYSMIMAGDILFAGGENKVAALSTKNGREIWSAHVTGTAYGLSVINGGLYVSTDKGHIYCFRGDVKGKSKVITPRIHANPYPRDGLTKLYAEAAGCIVKQTGISKGYCLVLDSGDGRLAYELARLTDLKIIGVEQDANKVAVARKALDEAGLYGQVVIHQGASTNLPYTRCFANLIVSDETLRTGKPPASANQVLELLRPYGGVVALTQPAGKYKQDNMEKWGQTLITDWKVYEGDKIVLVWARREKPEGAGEWTHMYAEPGNTACSADELVKGQVALQWFGRPGPRHMIDRHHRNVPPLFKDGRLFVPGDCIVFAVDAYNGTTLWEAKIPNSRRLGAFLDCGSMAVDEQFLYVVAEDKCHGFDVQTGKRRLTYTMPQLVKDEPRDWGYIAYSGNVLFGSGCRKDASYTETSYEADTALWHRNMKLVVSDYLFAMQKDHGTLWKYKDGLVVNTTVAVGGGRIYFVETHSPKALAEKLDRMPVKTLFDGSNQYLVALDTQTGRVVYKKKIDTGNFEEPVYLNYAKGVVLLSGSKLAGDFIRYCYYAFDAHSGNTHWNVSHDTDLPIDGGHGEYNRHPTIIDDTVYAWPYAYNLRTGERDQAWKFERRGHGCGGVSASARCLFWRGGNPWMYDLGPNGGPSQLNNVTRPGCWINIIPAGGLVLIPETSSGCTCGFPLQTSMAFIPK
ncbi:MAG: outer membrane protein assembly factor BamB family protein [Planctomycetota bacterium]|jgi:outer membrane protein assembly factor BamB